jgi:hypothetical protein
MIIDIYNRRMEALSQEAHDIAQRLLAGGKVPHQELHEEGADSTRLPADRSQLAGYFSREEGESVLRHAMSGGNSQFNQVGEAISAKLQCDLLAQLQRDMIHRRMSRIRAVALGVSERWGQGTPRGMIRRVMLKVPGLMTSQNITSDVAPA